MSERRTLPISRVAPGAKAKVNDRHARVVDEVIRAVDTHDLVIVGMAQNPHCKRARKIADEAGHKYTYVEYGSYLKAWPERLAIKMWSGWPTFPQVFCCGVLLGGADELGAEVRDGGLAKRVADGRA